MSQEKRKGILLAVPSKPAIDRPFMDHLTQKLTAAIRNAFAHIYAKDTLVCRCGATSPNKRHLLHNGLVVGPFGLHTLVWHRMEIPLEELDEIWCLDLGEAMPTDTEVIPPPTKTRGWS